MPNNRLITVFMGICAVCLVLLCAGVATAAVLYGPTIDSAMNSLESFETQMAAMNQAMADMTEATQKLNDLDIESLNALISESRTSVAAALAKLEEIDIDTLNDAIRNLNDTVRPFAEFFNQFN